MLLLRKKTATIKNITFFADDSDENQYWYMPSTIHIAQRDDKPVFSLIKYTGDDSGQEGGYINFEVNTAIKDSDLDSAFNDYLKQIGGDPAKSVKAPVPYDSGTVNFFVLDIKDGKGEDGKLISAVSSSLIGDNTAIFSAKLSPEQTVILEKAFQEAEAPAAVAYNLTYTGLTPALEVKVTAKFENVYNAFEAKFGVNIPIPIETPSSFWLGFDSVIEDLQQKQELIIEVKESLPSDEKKKEKEWALDFVKGEILKSFFTATLQPNSENNEQAKSTSDSIIGQILEAAKETKSLLPGGSLEMKMVHKSETKTLNFNYKSSQAVTRSAVPQNFIGSDILHAQKEPPYFIEVNVNDPFFQKINYTVLGPDTFSEYGIKAATFQLDYNNAKYTADAFTEDDQTWKKTISRSKDTNELFQTTSEFTFKSFGASGWEGKKSYNSKISTASNLLNLDPENFLTFNEMSIMIGKGFNWDKFNQVIVEVTYTDEDNVSAKKNFTFMEQMSEPQKFKYRCLTDDPWKISYEVAYYEVGGEIHKEKGLPNVPAIIVSMPAQETVNA